MTIYTTTKKKTIKLPDIHISRKKLLSNARAMISNQIGLPVGAIKMSNIISGGQGTDAFADMDLRIFDDYVSKFDGSPAGTERLLWNRDALKIEDKHLDRLTAEYKEKLLDKCFEIVERYRDI